MRKRIIGLGISLAFLISVFTATGIFAAKEEITFDVSYGKVNFTHKKHSETYKIDCSKCHHLQKSGNPDKCHDCHKAKAEKENIPSKEAFHKNCKGCHDELKKADKPAGPTGCMQCHKKK